MSKTSKLDGRVEERRRIRHKEAAGEQGIDSTGMVFKGMQDFLPAFADFSRGSPYDFTHVALTLPLGMGGDVFGLLQTEHSGIGFNPFVNESHIQCESWALSHWITRASSGACTQLRPSKVNTDSSGSVRVVTNQWGSPLRTYDYDVFGTPLQDRPERFRHGFTGKEYDNWTGLYNYGFRDYASLLGRFTTVDPIQDGHNWYAYVNSDPVSWIDPWGLKPCERQSGGDQKQTLDPKGRGVANNTDYYIALKLEDPVYIGDKKRRRDQNDDEKNWVKYIIAAPHTVVEGYFDGAIDMNGNIIKVSARYPDRVSFSAEYDENGKFVAVITDLISKDTNNSYDAIKSFFNKVFGKHFLLSDSYPNQKDDNAPLNDWWYGALSEVGDPGLWRYNIISPRQAKFREKRMKEK